MIRIGTAKTASTYHNSMRMAMTKTSTTMMRLLSSNNNFPSLAVVQHPPYARYLSASTSHTTPSSSIPIPMPKGRYPIIGHLPRMFGGKKEDSSIELWDALHKETGGDIFQIDAGFGKSIVVTKSVNHAQVIMAHQGRDCIRTDQPSWEAVFQQENWPTPGIPWARGEDHKRKRQVLAETLLMQKNAKQYVPLVVPIANRFVDCLTAHLVESNNTQQLRLHPDVSITQLAGMFALEAVMKVVVGTDFPALERPLPKPAVQFVESVKSMFSETATVEMVPHLHVRFNTKAFQRLVDSWKTMVRYPSETLQPVLEHYQQNNNQLPSQVQGTVLVKLMESHEAGNLSLDEVLHVGVQAIAAAVDTTAQTFEYLLYNLARNPDVQEKLYQQMIAMDHENNNELRLTIAEYEQQKYLFAVLKESMRITPTIGVHARTLSQDADLGDGHVVPKDQLVLINYLAMTQDEQLYPSPDLFVPERFLKQQQQSSATSTTVAAEESSPSTTSSKCPFQQAAMSHKPNPYAAIPFGHGARKCVGKAFAEMDIHLATMALLRNYRIEYDGPPLRQREESLLRPVQPMTPHFIFVPWNA